MMTTQNRKKLLRATNRTIRSINKIYDIVSENSPSFSNIFLKLEKTFWLQEDTTKSFYSLYVVVGVYRDGEKIGEFFNNAAFLLFGEAYMLQGKIYDVVIEDYFNNEVS